MKIDCYPHILPTPLFDSMPVLPVPTLRNPALYDLDERLRVMDRFPDYTQVLVPVPVQPLVPALGGADAARDTIRAGNEYLAEVVGKEPERFLGFAAALPLGNPDDAVAEFIHCVENLGALGVQLETNVGGVPITDERYEPVFAEAARRERTIWLHPVRGKPIPDFLGEETGRFGLWQALGWPYETSIVMARLVLGGIFDRHPDLKLIIHHGGAMVPHYCGRLGAVLEDLAGVGLDDELSAAVAALAKPVDDYFRMFYADTVLFGAGHAVQCVLDYFGVDHLLFGTDMPFDPEKGPGFVRDTIANVEALRLDDAQRAQVYELNARRLLAL